MPRSKWMCTKNTYVNMDVRDKTDKRKAEKIFLEEHRCVIIVERKFK